MDRCPIYCRACKEPIVDEVLCGECANHLSAVIDEMKERNSNLKALVGEASELLSASILSPMYSSLKERIVNLLRKLTEMEGGG